MRLHAVMPRLLMCCLTVLVCTRLVAAAGPWAAIALWAVGIGALCGAVATLMHLQAPGKISVINRIAGIVLPWGYAIGRGKLLPIVIESWLRWLLLGIAVVILTVHGSSTASLDPSGPGYMRGVIITVLLFLSWVIDAAVVFRLVTIAATRAAPGRMPPALIGPIVGISSLIAASVGLTVFASGPVPTGLALLLTGGPLVVVGGGCALMFGVMMTVGRHTRWN